MYISVKTNLPCMIVDNDFGWLSSEVLLVYREKSDSYSLATYEQHDEDYSPQWISYCSERWDITKEASHWTTFERKN